MWRTLLGMMAAIGAATVVAAPAAAVSPGLPTALSAADGREVDIAYNSDDDELVAIWVAKRVGAPGDAIWGQRFTGAGAAIGVPRELTSTGSSIRSPAIEYFAQHGMYYLAWVSYDADRANVIGLRTNDALTGGLGGPFGVSAAGAAVDPDAGSVDLAHRWAGNMWFVYDVDEGSPGVADDEHEIYRKSYNSSRTIVDDQTRVSETGTDGDAGVDATRPAVSWSDRDNLYYLMAWRTPSGIVGQVHWEVNGAPGLVRDDFQISSAADATDPAIAYSEARKQWMVVYTSGGHVLGRLIAGNDGALIGSEIDFTENADPTAQDPAVAWNAAGDEWVATWSGTSGRAPGEREIYLQRVPGVDRIIRDDAPLLRMSVMGPSGDTAREARRPAVAYAATAGSYFTAWEADHEADDVFRAYATLGQAADEAAPPLFPPPGPGPAVLANPDNAPPPSPPGGGTTRRSSAGLTGGTTIDLPPGDSALGVRVACAAGASCAGTLRADTVAAKKARAATLLGRTRFAIAAGKSKTIKLKLSKAARRTLARKHALKVKLTVALDGGATTKRTVTIKLKAKKKR